MSIIYRYFGDKSRHTLQDTLNERQNTLLSLIYDTSLGSDERRVLYCSEWLGYLPYGMYHWIEVNGRDISSQVIDMDNILTDLKQLVSLRKLKLIKGDFDEWTKDSSEDFCIELTLICS